MRLFAFASLLCYSSLMQAQSLQLMEHKKVTATPISTGGNFGYAVDLAPPYAVIGAANEGWDTLQQNYIGGAGACYIFELNGQGKWRQVQKVIALDRNNQTYLGYDVGMHNERFIAGAHQEPNDSAGGNFRNAAGAAYIFERNVNGKWRFERKLVASDRFQNDHFGRSSDIYGDWALVGANWEDQDTLGNNFLTSSGSAYFFERKSNGNWVEIQKVSGPNRQAFDQLGTTLSLYDSTAAICAPVHPYDQTGGNYVNGAGAVFIYELTTNGRWNYTQTVTPGKRDTNGFARCVDVHKNTMAVGGSLYDLDTAGTNYKRNAGAVFIFERNGLGVWVEKQMIVAPDRSKDAIFGHSVSLTDSLMLIGSPGDHWSVIGADSIMRSGSMYFYKKDGLGFWQFVQKFDPTSRDQNESYFNDVAMNGSFGVGGCWQDSYDTLETNYYINAGSVQFYNYSSCEPLLTVVLDTILHGDSVFTGNSYKDTSGIFYDYITSPSGCDSLVISEIVFKFPVGMIDSRTTDVLLCPNPSAGNTTLRGLKPRSIVSIYDLQGRLVHSLTATSSRLQLNTSHFRTGSYLLRVSDPEGRSQSIRLQKINAR